MHTKAQLLKYGSFHITNCSPNKEMHKDLKQSYAAANNSEFSNMQLLYINVAAEELHRCSKRR